MKIKAIISTVILGFAFLVTPVLARETPSPFPTPKEARLTQAALRSCTARENAVKNRMQSLTNLATNMEKVFDGIALKVEDFYTLKVLPSGKSLSNYDALVSEISTKKGMVDTDLATAQSLVDSFSCSSGDPRGLLTSFRLDMQKVKSDLKNYRTSIKNLIVAVRPLASEATGKPEATETP